MKKIFISFIALFSLASLTTVSAQSWPRTATKYDDGIKQKMEFRGSVGSQIGTKRDIAALLDLGLGYNFTSNFYLGLGSGIYPKFGVADGIGSDAVIPLMLDATYRINLQSESLSPFFQFRGGCLFHTDPDGVLESGMYEGEPYTRANYTAFDLGAGVYIRPVRNVDFRLSLHYAIAVPGDDGHDPVLNCTEHLLQFRAGIGLRGKVRSGSRAELSAEATRQLQEQRRQEHEQRLAEQAARRAEAERRAEEDRAARRAQREATASSVTSSLVQEIPVEFFCHITPSMMEGNNLNNDLIKLATLATGNQLASVIVLGYSNGQDVVKAVQNADSVRKHLNKRYYINSSLISTSYMGFDDIIQAHPRPADAIATIIIQKTPETK